MDKYRKQLYLVKADGLAIEHITNQTEELCLAAVKQNANAIRYINDQSDAVCLAAIERNCDVYASIHNRSPAVWLSAVRRHSSAFRYVLDCGYLLDRTDELCLEALKNNGCNGYEILMYHKKQTEQFCIAVVKLYPAALRYVLKQTLLICLEAMKSITHETAYTIRYVHNEFCTPELYKIAVERTGNVIQYIMLGNDKPTEEIFLTAVKKNGMLIQYIYNQTDNICINAIENNYNAFKFIRNQTPDLCLRVVKIAGHMLHFINKPTIEMCFMSVLQNENNKYFVPYSMKDPLIAHMITNVCIAFRSLKLPSYVLLEIIDWYLIDNKFTRYQKMQIIMRINEK